MFEVRSLACRRGKRLVFRDVGFAAGGGAMMLVTGRNGSGKSSLLRVLAGLLPAFAGEMFWQGRPLAGCGYRQRPFNYIGHLDALKPEMTAAETIGYWRVLRGQSGGGDCLGPVGLGPLRDRPVRMFSAGQKKRLALARLALDDAPAWLLDEPSASLDDEGRALLARLVAAHRARGGIAIIATHQPEDFKGTSLCFALDGAAA